MRITLISGATKAVLSDHGSESPQGLRIDCGGAVQTAEFVRAIDARSIHRGNRRTAIQFSVTRLHDSLQDASAFLATHAAELPQSGTLVIEFRGARGQRGERYLPQCALASVSGSHIGCSTIHQYAVVGGLITETKPA